MYSVEFFNGNLRFGINNIAFSIGDFDVYWYGIIIACGLLTALIYAYFRAKEFNINFDKLVNVILIGAIGSILCARIYYVAMEPDSISSIGDFFNLHNGGIAIYGAVIGAVIFGGIMCKISKINVFAAFDLASIGFLIGQSIGRWGNFMNQEAFGTNTDLPWGMWSSGVYNHLIQSQEELAAAGITVVPTEPVHPCFLYESIWCLLGFVVLHFLSRRRHYNGQTALQYIVWYGFGRFFIEGLRTDSLMIGSVRASQLLAALCVIVGIVLLIVFEVKHKKEISECDKVAVQEETDTSVNANVVEE